MSKTSGVVDIPRNVPEIIKKRVANDIGAGVNNPVIDNLYTPSYCIRMPERGERGIGFLHPVRNRRILYCI